MNSKLKRQTSSKKRKSLSFKSVKKTSPLLSNLTPRTFKEAKKNHSQKSCIESAKFIFYADCSEDKVLVYMENMHRNYKKYIKVISPIEDNTTEQTRYGLSVIFSQKTKEKNRKIFQEICSKYTLIEKVGSNSEYMTQNSKD